MSLFHLILLAVVQGITEFLPISSSAHLILVPEFLGEVDQGLMVDVGAHAGTLLAVVMIFWRETWMMTRGTIDLVLRRKTERAYLTWCLMVATFPGAIAGFLILNYEETLTRHIPLIIVSNIVWGAALWWADKKAPQEKTIEKDLTWKRALFVGLAQVIALVPGTSRSGITMTAARYMGFTRRESARLSFTMSIPITLGAVLAVAVKLFSKHPSPEELMQFAIVAGLSFVTALVTILGLMHWLKRFNFTPFVIYRFALAAFLVYWLYV